MTVVRAYIPFVYCLVENNSASKLFYKKKMAPGKT